MSATVYIGLGSNLQNPAAQLRQAIKALAALGSLDAVSSLYQTPPMGPQDQPDYVNAVVRLITELSPLALLQQTQAIENAQGRVRKETRWGERTLDLDILLYDDQIIELESLVVPHYGLPERIFVVKPLMEIAPNLEIPKFGQIAVIYDSIKDQPIERLSAC